MINNPLLFNPPALLATSLPEQLKEAIEFLSGGVSSALDMIQTGVLAANTGVNAASGGILSSLALSVFTFGEMDGALVGGIITYITGPVGFVMMVIAFLVGFINQYKAGKELTIDEVARPMFFLVLADLILTNIGPIISTMMGISNLGAQTLVSLWPQLALNAVFEEAQQDSLGNISLFGLLPLIFSNFIGMIFSIISSAILFVVLLTAKMEVLLRFSFAPIGLASIADESRKDEVFRYFKKLLASAFYLIAIIVALEYSASFATMLNMDILNSDTNVFTKAFASLETDIFAMALPFSAIGMVSVAKNIVNESFGV